MSDVNDAISRNINRAMTDDRFPRLRYDMELVILARDLDRGEDLIGGLGPFGTGCMWFKTDDTHKNYPGYNTAPHIKRHRSK